MSRAEYTVTGCVAGLAHQQKTNTEGWYVFNAYGNYNGSNQTQLLGPVTGYENLLMVYGKAGYAGRGVVHFSQYTRYDEFEAAVRAEGRCRSAMGMARTLRLVLMLWAGVLSACSEGKAQRLGEWRLVSSEGSPTVLLPASLPLPDHGHAFVLERQWTEPAPSAQGFDLVLLGVQSPASLEVDGVRAPVLRDGSGSAPAGRRTVVPQRFHIPEAAGPGPRTLRLRLANSWYQARWVEGVPRIVEGGAAVPKETLALVVNMAFAWLALGVGCQIGIMFLAVFLFGGRRTAYLWFGIQALTTATAISSYLTGYTQAAFGSHEGAVFGAALAIGNTVGIRFSHEFFDLKPLHWSFWLVTLVGVIIPACFSGPFMFTPYAAPLINTLISVHVGYQILLCIRLWRNRPDVRIALFSMSWIMLACAATPDQLAWWGLPSPLEGARLGGLAIFVFAVLQSILVASHYRGSLDTADALHQELQRKLDDLAQRTENLRLEKRKVEVLSRQLMERIEDRSRELAKALRQLAEVPRGGSELPSGLVLGERFELGAKLGEGGMGTVYLARDRATGEQVAVKLIQRNKTRGAAALQRVLVEARAAARISHPGVVRTLHVDVSAGGDLYLALELLQGTTLDELIKADIPPLPLACRVGANLAEVLAAAHAVGVLHRDVKPQNVMVCPAPLGLKILDFGLAKLSPGIQDSELSGDHLTVTGEIVGTAQYLSPEHAAGASHIIDKSDVYSLALVVFELTSGKLPFEAHTTIQWLFAHGTMQPERLRTYVPSAPAELEELLARCLHKDPEQRPSAVELARSLGAIADALHAPSSVALEDLQLPLGADIPA